MHPWNGSRRLVTSAYLSCRPTPADTHGPQQRRIVEETERAELESLVELSERLSLVPTRHFIYWGVRRNDCFKRRGNLRLGVGAGTLRILLDARFVAGHNIPQRRS